MNGIDLVVIGGGPAGYVPAIRAAQLGMRTVLVEEDLVGGTCLNRGCIPTKALAATAELLHWSRGAARMGLRGALEADYPAVARRRDQVVARLRKGVEARLHSLGVEVVRGHGELAGAGAVRVDGREIRTSRILLAPGSEPSVPRALAVPGALTSADVLSWSELPGSLLVVGGGVIGCEFASILSTFGVEVTLLEMLDEILPGFDRDAATALRNSMARAGVRMVTGRAAAGAESGPGGARVTLDDGSSLEAEAMVVATGRVPRLGGLGLSECGVEHDRKGIRVDSSMMTSVPGIYAAGDATGAWQLAHAGSAQGLAAVESMTGSAGHGPDPDRMPSCVFTRPEIAVAGPGEDEWRRRGVEVEVRTSRYAANGRALGLGESEGFVKLVASADGLRLLGAVIVGRDAGSLVGEAVAALGRPVSELAAAVHPHPTLCEMFAEAAEAFGPGAIHG